MVNESIKGVEIFNLSPSPFKPTLLFNHNIVNHGAFINHLINGCICSFSPDTETTPNHALRARAVNAKASISIDSSRLVYKYQTNPYKESQTYEVTPISLSLLYDEWLTGLYRYDYFLVDFDNWTPEPHFINYSYHDVTGKMSNTQLHYSNLLCKGVIPMMYQLFDKALYLEPASNNGLFLKLNDVAYIEISLPEDQLGLGDISVHRHTLDSIKQGSIPYQILTETINLLTNITTQAVTVK